MGDIYCCGSYKWSADEARRLLWHAKATAAHDHLEVKVDDVHLLQVEQRTSELACDAPELHA